MHDREVNYEMTESELVSVKYVGQLATISIVNPLLQ